jgi:hypothetical protein
MKKVPFHWGAAQEQQLFALQQQMGIWGDMQAIGGPR